jgi:hypothetical protein
MKKLLYILTCLLATGFWACEDENNSATPFLTVEASQLVQHVPLEGRPALIVVNTNTDFTVIASESWCHMTASQQVGEQIYLTVFVDQNTTTDTREATIILMAGAVPDVSIRFIQAGGSSIAIAENSIVLPDGVSNFTLDITSNYLFTFDLPDWIKLDAGQSPLLGSNTYSFTTVTPNSTVPVERSGAIVLRPADPDITETATVPVSQSWTPPIPDPVGLWLFDDPANIFAATIGQHLVPCRGGKDINGNSVALSLADMSAEISVVAGPTASNGAALVKRASFFAVQHGIAANGGGAKVNEYTLLIDFKIAAGSKNTASSDPAYYHTFLQTNVANDSDGTLFIAKNGNVGISGFYSTNNPCVQGGDIWYRYVVSVKCGEYVNQYVNGLPVSETVVTGANGTDKANIDNRFALDLRGFYLFGDEDGEDGEITVAEVRLWDKALPNYQAAKLGTVQ